MPSKGSPRREESFYECLLCCWLEIFCLLIRPVCQLVTVCRLSSTPSFLCWAAFNSAQRTTLPTLKEKKKKKGTQTGQWILMSHISTATPLLKSVCVSVQVFCQDKPLNDFQFFSEPLITKYQWTQLSLLRIKSGQNSHWGTASICVPSTAGSCMLMHDWLVEELATKTQDRCSHDLPHLV